MIIITYDVVYLFILNNIKILLKNIYLFYLSKLLFIYFKCIKITKTLIIYY